jgi:hypothetical protein
MFLMPLLMLPRQNYLTSLFLGVEVVTHQSGKVQLHPTMLLSLVFTLTTALQAQPLS